MVCCHSRAFSGYCRRSAVTIVLPVCLLCRNMLKRYKLHLQCWLVCVDLLQKLSRLAAKPGWEPVTEITTQQWVAKLWCSYTPNSGTNKPWFFLFRAAPVSYFCITISPLNIVMCNIQLTSQTHAHHMFLNSLKNNPKSWKLLFGVSFLSLVTWGLVYCAAVSLHRTSIHPSSYPGVYD